MSQEGYLQAPALGENWIYFQSDDDIFKVPLEGGVPSRLTSSTSRNSKPFLSPDGHWLAFLANDHGQTDVYVMPSEGGEKTRLTFWGDVQISGFADNNNLIIHSSENQYHRRHRLPYQINLKTKKTKLIKVGPADKVSLGTGKEKAMVIGRNTGDPALWKRYRGGTAGRLWLSRNGRNQFKEILKSLKGHLANPIIKGNRVYFISDHEGHGNVYSCNFTGTNLKRHTHHEDYYVRNFQIYEDKLVYQSGAEIFLLNLNDSKIQKVPIDFRSNNLQSSPRFEPSYKNIQDMDISEDGNMVAIVIRGQLHLLPPWGGAPIRLGTDELTRIKKPHFISHKDKKEIICLSMDEDSEETITLFDQETYVSRNLKLNFELGKVYQILPHPTEYKVAISNNRTEIWLVDLKTGKGELIEKCPYVESQSLNWSPCGFWLAYCGSEDKTKSGIKVWNKKSKETRFIISPLLLDANPVFDPDGKYLFFLGKREFAPIYADTHFELSFPSATRAYAICLRDDVPSPAELHLNFEKDDDDEEDDDTSHKSKKKTKGKHKSKKAQKKKDDSNETLIDFEGIDHRIIALSTELSNYFDLTATKDKVYFIKSPPTPLDPNVEWRFEEESYNLYCYDMKSKKAKLYHEDVEYFSISKSQKQIILETDGEVRVLELENKPTDGEGFHKKDGWVDLNRIKVKIDPKKEWQQMFRESWILQRENFWTPDLSKVNWKEIYERYIKLLPKVNTRQEFSDLVWEMQGELGTSHCYEFMGDYHKAPTANRNGKLGADLIFDVQSQHYTIQTILNGDSWIPGHDSPLNGPGVNLKPGDKIHGINGMSFKNENSINEQLEGLAGKTVQLEIQRGSSKKKENVNIKTLSSSTSVAYRNWVNKNREYVHRKSRGKLGYVHVPDMSVKGYSEFFRHYLSEFRKDGLIVDVRFNGGGNVSQHILKFLKQKVIGFDQTRHFGHDPYPLYAVPGEVVCLTNEFAGSDGDIFSHSFKLMQIGKLIGKRTWGGVVGIWPRFGLIEGTYVSQPEFSFWFQDVGYAVENYGTDPDIEVEITPDDWIKGVDPQLDRSIAEGLKGLKKNPPLKIDQKSKPNLKPPRLPKS